MKLNPLNSLALAIPLLSTPVYAAQYKYHPEARMFLGSGFNPKDPDLPFANCLEKRDPEKVHGGAERTSITIRAVKSESDIHKEVGISTEIDASYAFFKGKASANYAHSSTSHSDSFIFVITAKTNYGREILPDPVLKADYRNRSIDDLKRICGPEIVTEQTRGVTLFGVFTLKNDSHEEQEKFTANLQASVSYGLGSAALKASMEKAMSLFSANSQMSMEVFAIGGQGITGMNHLVCPGTGSGPCTLADQIANAPRAMAEYMETMTFENSVPISFHTLNIEQLLDQTLPPVTRYFNEEGLRQIYDRYLFVSNSVTQMELILENRDPEYMQLSHSQKNEFHRKYYTPYLKARDQLREAGKRCLEGGTSVSSILENLPCVQWPEKRSGQAGGVSCSSSAQARATSTRPVQIAPFDSRVPRPFSELGSMYQVGSLIWSAVAPEAMNYEVALQYCKNLGEGARLPSLEEWKALARSLGKGVAGKKYDYKLLPDLNREFWSSTPQKDDLQSAYLFNGNFGAQGFDSREFELAVRCVMNAGL